MRKLFVIMTFALLIGCSGKPEAGYRVKIDGHLRAEQVKDLKFGMFICWSFSTFYGKECTPTPDKDALFFKATNVDTDQWARVAKEAGMNYILFLTKHHDGFCLYDHPNHRQESDQQSAGN